MADRAITTRNEWRSKAGNCLANETFSLHFRPQFYCVYANLQHTSHRVDTAHYSLYKLIQRWSRASALRFITILCCHDIPIFLWWHTEKKYVPTIISVHWCRMKREACDAWLDASSKFNAIDNVTSDLVVVCLLQFHIRWHLCWLLLLETIWMNSCNEWHVEWSMHWNKNIRYWIHARLIMFLIIIKN